ncbi:MAG TPA: M2 family metallopeptidase [Anaeromyxobacteraceae bacterium]|nr:M2 family metallopeptidase [Anaeromyxobacteraceae bacterium]
MLSIALPALLTLAAAAPPPSAADATAFVEGVGRDLRRLMVRQQTADWIKSTDITDDTERNAAALAEDVMAYLSAAIPASARFDGVDVDPATRRQLHLLRIASTLPAPADPAKRAELAATAAGLEGLYGKGKYCGPIHGTGGRPRPPGAPVAPGEAHPPRPALRTPPAQGSGACRDLQDLEEILATSRDPRALLDAWTGWHAVAREMRQPYQRLVALGDEGAREIGYADLGELWRAGYDMAPAEFEADGDRLWAEVKPLYEQLHCHVRARLQQVYGKQLVPDGQPIPAHLLGNMWAQDWSHLYPLVEPYPGAGSLDVDAALRAQRWDAKRMVKAGEAFFTSLGLDPLPPTFWERSLLTKPRDREVVCHASAWDVTYSDDLRIKMCIRPTEEDLVTIHHELGHDYYFHAYFRLPILFQQGANDGFHEAIGDAVALSITPAYLRSLGLVRELPGDAEKGVVNFQMRKALDKIAFLPFAKLVDRWRWDVFAGKTPPDRYVADWWDLRRALQGVAPPAPRTEEDFDPGAKYHVASNTPYARYFLAAIYQFQFHEALCRAAGQQGPLHACSIHGSKEAGRRLQAMLALGASRPWPDAFEALTGSRRAEARPLLEYFAPLRAWLERQNAGRRCGW